MNNGRDCAHGRQIGKCDTCELIDAEQRILELEAKVEQLKITGKELVSQAERAMDFDIGNYSALKKCANDFDGAAETAPQQCLAEIKAQAGRDGFIAGSMQATVCAAANADFYYHKKADEYANKIREQAKGE